MKWLGRPSQVKSFEADSAGLGTMARAARGISAIPVSQIVGSVGRAAELNADFRLLDRQRNDDCDRLRAIQTAMERGVVLPPIEVYLLQGHYYVVDGHHRVSGARSRGQLDIDAVVTEFWPTATGSQALPAAA